MKLTKAKRNLIFFLIFVLTLNVTKSDSEWCWTKSMANDPTWVFNKEAGNVNWGYCKSEEDKERIVKYGVELRASSLPESVTAPNISIQVFGSQGALDTKTIALGTGKTKKEKFKDKDIGILNKLTVFISEGIYRCQDITISKGPNKYTFRCLTKMGPCSAIIGFNASCMVDLIPDGETEYEVTIKTGDPIDSTTTSPVLVSVAGKKGSSDYLMFSDRGLPNASKMTKKFYLNDVGDLTGFNLKLEDSATWKPEYIIIAQPLSNQLRQWPLKSANFGPGNLVYMFDTNGSVVPQKENKNIILNDGNFNPKLKDMFKQLMNFGKNLPQITLDGGDDSNISFDGNVDLNNPEGGMITPEELENVLDLECDQQMINPSPDQIIFGDNLPTANINYMNIIARCPANCHRYVGIVVGMGIHPENTPICLAAMVDNAISEYGGIISLSIYPGLKFYGVAPGARPDRKKNITISTAITNVKKSFTVAKVDNPDLVEKDFRILDHNGKLSYEGRLEIRINGVWRTICNRRLDLSAARMICRELGYNDGKWEEDVSCNGYNGENYCGSQNMTAIFSDLLCQDYHKKFAECNKKIADEGECGRDYDAVLLCTNINYDTNKLIENGTVKLENVENDFDGTVGRLEYFMKEWGTICGLGATDKTADLGCKKMGYKSGVLDDQKRFKRGKSDNTKVMAILECLSTHTTLGNCKVKTKDLNCDHSNDLIVRCIGGEGDYSGRSQYPKDPAVGPPRLGKLGMESISVQCMTMGNNIVFRGDPGSIFYVTCPADCHKVSGQVWGTGLYTSDSNICLAAIHSGVIKISGGTFVLIKTWGQVQYKGSFLNGMMTNSFNRPNNISMTFAIVNSGWKNMMNYAKMGTGTIFLEKSSAVSLIESSHFVNKILKRKANVFSSFLEENTSIPEPVWEWLENDSKHKFSNTGAIQINDKPLPTMETYTVVMQFKMADFKGRNFLFSCSENRGFNVFVDDRDNLIVGSLTGSDSIDTDLQIPQNQMTVVYIANEKDKMTIFTFASGPKRVEKKKRTIQSCPKLGIGRHATNDQDYFYGTINFIQFFNKALDPSLVPGIIDSALRKPKSTSKVNKNSTVDNRPCISSCTNAPLPGNPGAPKMPPEADPYPPDVNSLNAENQLNKGCDKDEISEVNIEGIENVNIEQITKLVDLNVTAMVNEVNINVNNVNLVSEINTVNSPNIKTGTMEVGGGTLSPIGGGSPNPQITNQTDSKIFRLTCEITLRDKRLQGSTGQRYRVRCDEDCSIRKDINVFGSYIYGPDSSVCKAAYHSGTLEKGTVGYIIVELLEGKKIYNQSVGSDGSLSVTSGPENRSFLTRAATPPIKITCSEAANSNQFVSASVGKKFLVLCPKNCSKNKNEIVYGEEVYTDTSPICPAAIHWGMITDQGGEFEFLIEGSQTTYKGTKGFGVDSVARGQYVRSFRILGIRPTIYGKFKEDFEGKFSEKYQVFPDPTSYKVPTEGWSFQKIDSVVIHQDKVLWAISNKTKIVSNYGYGTHIILKDTEFVNGRVRASWMFSQLLTHAILFRYQDIVNYYALEFNLDNRIGPNLRLVKRVEGKLSTVTQARRKLFLTKWYKFSILLNFDAVTVLLQSDNLRMDEVILEAKMGDIYRGTIGFASNGATDFNISGIEIDNHFTRDRIKDSQKNRRTWNKILQQVSEKDRKTYCKSEFMADDPNLKYCLMPRVYCKIRCDDQISPIENIANYNCFKDCMRTLKEDDAKIKKAAEAELLKIKKNDKELPSPKVGTKVDFLPPYGKSNQDFTPGTIKEVKISGSKFYVDISYETGFNNVQVDSNLEYPGDGKRIQKCKTVLTRRSDCDPVDKSLS